MAESKHLRTEFGIHHWYESCMSDFIPSPLDLSREDCQTLQRLSLRCRKPPVAHRKIWTWPSPNFLNACHFAAFSWQPQQKTWARIHHSNQSLFLRSVTHQACSLTQIRLFHTLDTEQITFNSWYNELKYLTCFLEDVGQCVHELVYDSISILANLDGSLHHGLAWHANVCCLDKFSKWIQCCRQILVKWFTSMCCFCLRVK